MELTKKPNPIPTSKTATLYSATKSGIKSAVFSQNKSCILCETKQRSICFPITIHKALYTKFASSQNYYYTREINDILLSNRSSKTIDYRDIIVYDELAEYLKRFYCQSEFKYKIRILTEYYKFHRDIPRLFMLPIMTTLNKYLDKKRRLDYIKITRIINEENKNEEKQIEVDGFIDSLGDSSSQRPQNSIPVQNIKIENILKDCFDERSKNEDISNFTVQDWKAKLKELTNNSIHIDQSACSYLDIDVRNGSIGNLTKFLDFMQKNSKDLENKGKFGQINKNKVAQLKLDDKQRNLTEEFKILNSGSSNKESKAAVFERNSNINTQKLSLTKKLALLNEKAKGNILSLTERSANKIKFNEMFSKNTEKMQIKRVLTPENQKEIPLVKLKNENTNKIIKNDIDISKKSKPVPETKQIKIDHNLLNLLLNKVIKKKNENLKLKVNKNPEKPPDNENAKVEKTNSKKEKIILQIKKEIFQKIPIESPKIKSIEEKKVHQTKKPSHNRIFSNEITKRNSQPNPLYFERSINNKGEGKKPETSRTKVLRSNKASILRASYNNITGHIDVKCLTERSKEQTPTAAPKEKIKQNPINFHKYTKSEPKLLAKGEVAVHSINSPKKSKPNTKNSSSGQFFTYNNNNVVNIFFNESHKTLPSSSSQLFFDKMKGNLQKVDHSKKNEDLRKLKEKIQLDLHLNLHTG